MEQNGYPECLTTTSIQLDHESTSTRELPSATGSLSNFSAPFLQEGCESPFLHTEVGQGQEPIPDSSALPSPTQNLALLLYQPAF